jgi:hypothetical protein
MVFNRALGIAIAVLVASSLSIGGYYIAQNHSFIPSSSNTTNESHNTSYSTNSTTSNNVSTQLSNYQYSLIKAKESTSTNYSILITLHEKNAAYLSYLNNSENYYTIGKIATQDSTIGSLTVSISDLMELINNTLDQINDPSRVTSNFTVFIGLVSRSYIQMSTQYAVETLGLLHNESKISMLATQKYGESFVDNNLPNGATWSVKVGNQTKSSTNNTIKISLLNGTYNFTAFTNQPLLFNEYKGTVVVNSNKTYDVNVTTVPEQALVKLKINYESSTYNFDWFTIESSSGQQITTANNYTYGYVTFSPGFAFNFTVKLLENTEFWGPEPNILNLSLSSTGNSVFNVSSTSPTIPIDQIGLFSAVTLNVEIQPALVYAPNNTLTIVLTTNVT